MARGQIGVLVTIGRVPFVCQVCKGEVFYDRTVMVAMRGAWTGAAATVGLVCARCGYIHLFMNDRIEFWQPEHGYPG